MKLVIFGATGKTGLKVVQLALELKYEVRAFVRDLGKMPIFHANLEVVQGDVLDQKAVEQAVSGVHAVVCVLGGSSIRDKMRGNCRHGLAEESIKFTGKISIADTSLFILDQLDDDTYQYKMPCISY